MSENNLSKFRLWTKSEEKILIDRVRNKISIENIIEEMGRTKRAVTMRINKIIYDLSTTGNTNAQIALLLNMDEKDVISCISDHKSKDNHHSQQQSPQNNLIELINILTTHTILLSNEVKLMRADIAEIKKGLELK